MTFLAAHELGRRPVRFAGALQAPSKVNFGTLSIEGRLLLQYLPFSARIFFPRPVSTSATISRAIFEPSTHRWRHTARRIEALASGSPLPATCRVAHTSHGLTLVRPPSGACQLVSAPLIDATAPSGRCSERSAPTRPHCRSPPGSPVPKLVQRVGASASMPFRPCRRTAPLVRHKWRRRNRVDSAADAGESIYFAPLAAGSRMQIAARPVAETRVVKATGSAAGRSEAAQ